MSVVDTTQTRAQQHAALRRDYAAGLRALADVIDAAEVPLSESEAAMSVMPWFPDTRDELIALTHAARAAGATVERDPDDHLYRLRFRFGPLLATAIAYRADVCERVVVGTREIVEMVPDPAAPAPPMVEIRRQEEVVEYRCPDDRPTPVPHPVLGQPITSTEATR